MDESTRIRRVGLWATLGLGVASALFAWAYRTESGGFFLLGWLAYCVGLVGVMAWFKWSDVAMSVCTLLMLLPPIGFLFLAEALW
ncbi:MAG TPA: hypothetical protein VGG30_00595 [Pirellulales bacterium]